MVVKERQIVVHISNWHTKWIIGGIFREAAAASDLRPYWRVYPTSKNDFLNPHVLKGKISPLVGDLNIYAHQDTYFSVFANKPERIVSSRNRVFFTHFNVGQNPSASQISSLKYCERILVQNESMENFLISAGISKEKIARAPGAVSRDRFHPDRAIPGQQFVLFSGNFKYRKNPELIAQVISVMPEVEFVIHGLNWEEFPKDLLNGIPNLKRMDFRFTEQPKLMRMASLYVSLAVIEGGPYPVLEALASGTPVVATDTGFCAEFINDANGILLPNPPELSQVQDAIRAGLKLKESVWSQDLLHGNWQLQDIGNLIFS
ncbi:glycosyltransferase family 4 protein [Candidatus Planktophila dulcis]|uniref:glycosyltransferase family 4 protein n=1 Tax=Candidatus Planktophila dulcis TaxID=1884914 RepID=UPI003BEF433C